MAKQIEKIIASTFMEMAHGLETGTFGKRPKIAITGIGSELGEENALEGAIKAARSGIDVTYIGSLSSDELTVVKATTEDESHKIMEQLLSTQTVDGAVTMHYPFPIGVSTVGRVITPARGKEMFIATTTGTSSSDRISGMIKNAVYGIIAAKASGVKNPTIGILNVDGARQVEKALKELKANGLDIEFAESGRLDGGAVMRGNDVLSGTPDVMVCDPLSGNILMKMLSSFVTGGNFEASGYGYGPGIGEGYDKLIMILSRASGAPVITGAIEYAAQLVRGKWLEVSKEGFKQANAAGLNNIINQRMEQEKKQTTTETVTAPPKEIVTADISGIEIMDLDDGVSVLWKLGIYAESGMGCTGPIILVNEKNHTKAKEELTKAGFIS